MRVLLETLVDSDIPVRLSTIFNEVVTEYTKLMDEREQQRHVHSPVAQAIAQSNGKIEAHPAYKRFEQLRAEALQELAQKPAMDEASLVRLFQRGRDLDRQCIPSPTTEHYLVARDAANAILKRKGFGFTVY